MRTNTTALLLTALASSSSAAVLPCRIDVVEQGSGWPVPMVELRTTHNVRFVSDNAGIIAFDIPELMGRETWFDVIGQGYERPKDGFGYRGVRLVPEPGKTLRVEVQRLLPARRIGRVTGAGLLAESEKLGLVTGVEESGVLGCDSVQNAVHKDRLFWVWGDTTMARYPLGIFNGTGATTPIHALQAFEPPLKLKLDYFKDAKSAPRGVAEIPGEGPTWLSGFISLPDKTGTPRLVASYVKIKPPMDAYECGLAVWDERTELFKPHKVIWSKSKEQPKAPPHPDGHPVLWTNTKGKAWVLFGNPFPFLRCPASFESWEDPAAWEPLNPQRTLKGIGQDSPVKPHTGSIALNPWRKRWVTVFMEQFGKPSAFGELWYAEANAPEGPWGPAVKVVTHDHYTFYNPRVHPEFTPENSPLLFFEGTFTIQFSDGKQPTPRYDYNQVLYRLDLDDPALGPAQVAGPL